MYSYVPEGMKKDQRNLGTIFFSCKNEVKVWIVSGKNLCSLCADSLMDD